MSRIGKLPIDIPNAVDVIINKDNSVTVKGKLGTLNQDINNDIKVKVENNKVVLERSSDMKKHKSLHGLYRALIANMVKGVSEGYSTKLELNGVGYKATTTGQVLDMSLGFSHNIIFELPIEIKVEAETQKRSNPIITLTSIDKQLLGQVVAKIRSFRKPEPYKGKGIKFIGEHIRRKQGKLAASAS